MPAYSQRGRALAVTTPLGADAVLLRRVTGAEGISEIFCYRLDMLAAAPIDFSQVLNRWATVQITLPNGSSRLINGVIRRLSQGGWARVADGEGSLLRYTAELVPALWRLSRASHSRVFQNQTVPQILQSILQQDWQLDLSLRLTRDYPPRTFCVQYRESDLAFVSRLMEEEGIGYYFVHEADASHERDRHTLVLADSPSGYVAASATSIAYHPAGEPLRDAPRIWDWVKTQDVCPATYTVDDYHFQLPDASLTAHASVADKVALGSATHVIRSEFRPEQMAVYEPYGGFATRFDGVDSSGAERSKDLEAAFVAGPRLAEVRAQEAAARSLIVRGSGDAAQFQAGQQFTLTRHFDADDTFLLTRVSIEASLEGAYTGDKGDAALYYNEFVCIPAALPYRPRLVTRKPRVEGPQTAVVVGPKDMPVFVDKFGRVKVRFHWDQGAKSDGHSSCWVRVSQAWAGDRWGAFFWPRPGHEVVVAFEEGDPDRPLITGSVYNARNMPPLPLPKEAESCGFKSCTLGGEPAQEFSCVVFHDSRNSEHLELHSQNHLQCTSEASEVKVVPGPHMQFTGTQPFGSILAVGSGSGGGLLDLPELGGQLYHHFKPDGCNKFTEAWNSGIALFPGDYRSTGGDLYSAVLGAQHTHIFGSEVKIVGDPDELFIAGIKSTKGPLKKFVHDPVVPAPPHPTGAALASDVLEASALGGGTLELTLGSRALLNYGGPHVSVTRGSAHSVTEPEFWASDDAWAQRLAPQQAFAKQISKAVRAVTTASVVVIGAGHLVSRILSESPGTATFSPNQPWYAQFAWTMVYSRLMGILVALESNFAQLRKARDDAEAADNDAAEAKKVADKAITDALAAQGAIEKAVSDSAEALTDKMRKKCKKVKDGVEKYADKLKTESDNNLKQSKLLLDDADTQIKQSVAQVKEVTDKVRIEKSRIVVEAQGLEYDVAASKVRLNALGEDPSIEINAGNAKTSKGRASVAAPENVDLKVPRAQLTLSDDGKAGNVVVQAEGDKGGMHLKTPKADLVMRDGKIGLANGNTGLFVDDSGVLLSKSGGGGGVFVESSNAAIFAGIATVSVTDQTIELKVGDACSLVIDAKSITLKGLELNLDAQMRARLKGLMLETEGEGQTTTKGAVLNINQ